MYLHEIKIYPKYNGKCSPPFSTTKISTANVPNKKNSLKIIAKNFGEQIVSLKFLL